MSFVSVCVLSMVVSAFTHGPSPNSTQTHTRTYTHTGTMRPLQERLLMRALQHTARHRESFEVGGAVSKRMRGGSKGRSRLKGVAAKGGSRGEQEGQHSSEENAADSSSAGVPSSSWRRSW